jgi:hypothetical protein
LRDHYDCRTPAPLSKLHALTIMAAEQQTYNYYMNVGPLFSDPMARLLYAEIASIEEQHTTQYESIIDADERWLEKWVLHEANQVYNYHACVTHERNPRIKALWERFLDYEPGRLHVAIEQFRKYEKREVEEILPASRCAGSRPMRPKGSAPSRRRTGPMPWSRSKPTRLLRHRAPTWSASRAWGWSRR